MEASLIAKDPVNPEDLVQLQCRSSFAERRYLAHELAKRINNYLEAAGICQFNENRQLLEEEKLGILNYNGCVALGSALHAGQVEEIVAYFKETPCFNAHLTAKSDLVGRYLNAGADRFPFGSFLMEDVIAAPHMLALANSEQMLGLAAGYLGCTPSLYSMNAWWSFPGHAAETEMTQGFHRDEDDFRNCVLFLYLTDSDEKTGAHEYIRGTHRQDLTRNLLEGTSFPMINLGNDEEAEWVRVEFNDLFYGAGYKGESVYRKIFGPQITLIGGKAGEAFFSDPAGLHRARPPETSARLIIWIRYGYYANRAYQNDKLSPIDYDWSEGKIPDTPKHRYINRLIVSS